MPDQHFILTTVLPDCLNRLENESVFRSVRRPQPGSREFLETVVDIDLVIRPRTFFVFYDRVPTSETFRHLTAVYELREIEQNADEPVWRDDTPNYQLRLQQIKTLNPPLPFGQASALWKTLETTRGKKTQNFFNSPRVLLRVTQDDFDRIADFVLSDDEEETLLVPAGAREDAADVVSFVSPTERLLEDYLVEHLNDLEPGLEPYEADNVRQYPTGDGGRIDILCRDKLGNPVVVELKRAGAREEVVGQLCRYTGWVMELEPQALVRGIIVANVIDARLKYAARAVPNVRLIEYQVNFTLREPK